VHDFDFGVEFDAFSKTKISFLNTGCGKDALALALLSRRVLVLPKKIQCRRKKDEECTIESQFFVDRMLTCNRALMGAMGHFDKPDEISNCSECKRLCLELFFFLSFFSSV
jgi:hypothetical protein